MIFRKTKIKKSGDAKGILRLWLKPFLILLSIGFAIFIFNRIVDALLYYYNINFFQCLFNENTGDLTNTLGGLGEVASAVLGLEITVVAIVVQLAANRYSSKIMELFLEDKINISVFAAFVIITINTVLVTNTISESFVPYFSIFITLCLIVGSYLLVIPHFAYVSNFLRPENFLKIVRNRVNNSLTSLFSNKVKSIETEREYIYKSISFVGDITLNSIYQGDRAVALLSMGILREIVNHYAENKEKFPNAWFKLSGYEYFDPDFASFSRFVMDKIEEKKVIFERKILRLYELFFNVSRSKLEDVMIGALLNTELVATTYILQNDKHAYHTVFQYFNSYLRLAINSKDVRTAFNILEHYRILAETLLKDNYEDTERICYYFKYYGHEALKNNVPFILEIAAYDLAKINEAAFKKKVPNAAKLLDLFLTLDEPFETEDQKKYTQKEVSLLGVRIAQVKLATFYLQRNEIESAKLIFDDMKNEPLVRIKSIYENILSYAQEEYWEITPRGINFYYLPPDRHDALKEFISWFEEFSPT